MSACALALGCTAAVPEPGVVTEAVHDEGLFELDRNAVSDATVAGDDWDVVNSTGGSSSDSTGVIPDGNNATVFHTGGSKDDLDITSWRHRATGSVPDKDNITNAYAAAYQSTSGDTIVYFGMDRIDTSGDANMGFWFFQQLVSPNSDGSFSGTHTVGDILVQVDYTQGGTVPNVRILEWVGTGGAINGTLAVLFEGSADCLAPSQDTVCATTNLVETESPWTYIQKGETTDGPFPPRAFVEGGINISALFGENEVPCFASFMATTRASTSVDAVLKDFVLDTFEACGIEITKTCDQGRVNEAGTGFEFDYHITVTNSGGGTLHDVTITDSLAGMNTVLPAPLAPGASTTLDRTFTSSTNGPFENTASVTAAAVSGGPVVVSGTASDTCEAADVDAEITVDKTCSPRLEVVNGRVVVTIDGTGQVCNTGNVALTNVSVTDDCGSGPSQTQMIGTLPVADPTAMPPETGCRTWTISCAPSMSDPDPEDASFTDTATATGTPALGGSAVNDTSDPATCALCPEPTSSLQ